MQRKFPYHILGVSAGNGVMIYPFRENLIANIECRSDYYTNKRPVQWYINFNANMYRNLETYLTSYNRNTPVDVIIGHPKCGNSSMFALSRGKKFTSHKGEPSLDLYFQAIWEFKPKFFFMENLLGLLNTYSESDFKELFPNYKFIFISGSVTMFGNSQVTRKRLLIIGIRNDIYRPTDEKIFRRFKPFEPRTTGDLLKDLPINGNIREPLDETITMYSGFKITLKEAQEYWLKHPNERHWKILNGTMGTAPGVYINREDDIPLTVRKTNRQFNPDGLQMSPRELARIQGVPDQFLLYQGPNLKASINKGRITVGNTPPMEMGMWIYNRLAKFYRKCKA